MAVSADELLAGEAFGAAREGPPPVVNEDLLALSPAMRAFLDEHVHRRANDSVKLHELVAAIINERSFGLAFTEVTRTAAETFRLRTGNCLSFAAMFVALAREVGLDAVFQEVDIPPDWSLHDDVFVLNRHVNVRVNLGSGGVQVVDFNIDDFRASYDTRTISTTRAMAHYYNNIGVERMQAGDAGSALACFRQALADTDRRFAPAWTNLGTLYLRFGYPVQAEAAYLQALKADRGDLVAMSNFAALCERRGDLECATEYRKRVAEHRLQNPYYRYHRAREAFAAGDWDAAITHLKFAIRRKRNEDEFYALLGACHLAKGDEPAARRWLERAAEVAATDQLRQRYASKIDLLPATSSLPQRHSR